MTSPGGARTSTGTYVRLCEIASGGMGSVDLAMRREGTFRRLFAIKRLLSMFRDDSDVRGMFLDEARIAGLLRHPNAVSVVDVGEDEGGPFLVMDYVEGLSLGSIMSRVRNRGEQVDVQVCARMIAQCAHGLHAAHELRGHDGGWLNLVHRDVSPQNILVGFDGIVRLTDFGIAKAAGRATRTSTGLLKGKLSYMAPEQLRFEESDRRSDLFSLGIVAYELVSGTRLFKSETPRDAARKILNEDAPDVRAARPEVPEEVARVIAEMLARDPARRPAEASTIAVRLEEIAASLAAKDGARDVASFMRGTFEQARDESSRRIADAIAGVESSRDVWIDGKSEPAVKTGTAAERAQPVAASEGAPTQVATPARAPAMRPVRAILGLAIAMVVGAIGAIAWAGTTGRETPASVPRFEPASAPERATAPPEPAPEPVAEPVPERTVEPASEPGPEPAVRAAPRRTERDDVGAARRRTKRWDWE